MVAHRLVPGLHLRLFGFSLIAELLLHRFRGAVGKHPAQWQRDLGRRERKEVDFGLICRGLLGADLFVKYILRFTDGALRINAARFPS